VRCIVTDYAMPWLADTDVGATLGFVRAVEDSRTDADLRRRALAALGDLVPADCLTWDRVELATGAMRHEAVPAEAEHPGAFDTLVGCAADHPVLAAHAARRRPALRLSELVERRSLARSEFYGDLLHAAGVEYEIAIGMRTGRGEAVVAGLGRSEREFSERDRDVLNLVRAGLEDALRVTRARGRLARALAAEPPPGAAVVLLDRWGEVELSSVDAERWLAEHFGPADHPGWLPAPVAEWLALPPRPPLVSERDGRRLTVRLLPGDPHALLLEEEVASFRPDALHRRGLTRRENEVLRAATAIEDEAEIACELFLSLHAVRARLERLEAKLGVRTAADAVARALGESA
jgi:DNA-binding CsgD family transcriptional regulator